MKPSIPVKLIESLQGVPGFDSESFIAAHDPGSPITSIRLNPDKHSYYSVNRSLFEKVPWCSEGLYLPQRPSFTLDPEFHAGTYYVQEASSMFLEEAIKQAVDTSQPLRVLDLCAAPGGKSTLLQSLISDDSLLVSNEVIKSRVRILEENISKWGGMNVVVTSNDARDFNGIPGFFDVIVIDAPRSGSGLFRKEPEAIKEWSQANVMLCCNRQKRIFADVVPSLKPGGILIYSTCSYSVEEDEMICDSILSEGFISKRFNTKE